MTKYFVDKQGVYIGGFDGAEPPAGAIEVPFAPAFASDIWDGKAWQAGTRPVPMITADQLLAAWEKKGTRPTKDEVLAEKGALTAKVV